MKKEFTHIGSDEKAKMVDISSKVRSSRKAIAISHVKLNEEISNELESGEIRTKKGPVFQTAILAGIMAAKKTSELIPLCHPIAIDSCNIKIKMKEDYLVEIISEVSTDSKTGVEMEALTAASVAALTIYDMCKAFSHDLRILETRLIEKTGGKSDFKKS